MKRLNVVTFILGLSILLALIWAGMATYETRQFDRKISGLRRGMPESEVRQLLGKPGSKVAGEEELDRHQKASQEWFADFRRPVQVNQYALDYAANERQAYIYFDEDNKVTEALVAKKGKDKNFNEAGGRDFFAVTRADFDALYQPWQKSLASMSPVEQARSTYWGGAEGRRLYNKITALGPGAMPYIIDEMEQGEWRLNGCAFAITHKRFAKTEYPDQHYGGAQSNAALLVKWWRQGPGEAPRKFNQFYSEWKTLQAEGKSEAAAAKLDEIRWLGIEVLPLLVDKVEQGESGLIPVITRITNRGKHEVLSADMSAKEISVWWQKDNGKWELPTAGRG